MVAERPKIGFGWNDEEDRYNDHSSRSVIDVSASTTLKIRNCPTDKAQTLFLLASFIGTLGKNDV